MTQALTTGRTFRARSGVACVGGFLGLGLLCVGYLWPLWDAERQTFADKLMHTVAVTTPVEPLPRRATAS